jgi:hypothetical protein
MTGTIAFHSIMADTQPDLVVCKKDADNETINGTILDMLGYQGVVFFLVAGKGEVANVTLKAQQDTAAAMGGAADLEGTSVTIATAVGTDSFGFLEVQNPVERYVRCVVGAPNITTPALITVVAVRYGKNWLPETNADGEVHVAPAEGTA